MTNSSAASPKTMGPYEILGPIGTGGMATVLKAYQPRLDRYVAIKMLHAMFLSDQGFLARFEREGRVVASLNHPNIIPLYDYDQDPDTKQPYLVMRLIEGQSLKERIVREGPPPLSATLEIITAIANALTYAHSRGVLHRDVKPSNIILAEDNTPYLMDFGLARMIKAGESTMSADMMIGTPHYISPEQAQGSLVLDARTDVYSLGVVLYELVVGRLPFSGDTPFIIVHKHIYEPPTPPRDILPDLPVEVEAVLLKALSKDPQDRYETPDALTNAFRQAVANSGMVELSLERRLDVQDTAEAFPVIPSARAADMMGDDTLSVSSATAAAAGAAASASGGHQRREVSIPQTPTEAEAVNSFSLLSQQSLQEGVIRFREAVYDIRHTLQDRERLRSLGETGEHLYVQVKTQFEQMANEGEFSWNWKGSKEGSTSSARRPWRGRQKLIEREWGTSEQSVRARVEGQLNERRGLAIHASIYAMTVGLMLAGEPQIRNIVASIFADSAPMQPLVDFPFGLMIAFAWGGGLLAHLLDVVYKTGYWGQRRRRDIDTAMQRRFGPDWTEIATDREYRTVSKQAVKPMEERLGFLQHFVVTLGVLGVMFAVREPLPRLLSELIGDTDFTSFIMHPQLVFLIAMILLVPVVIHGAVVALSPMVGDAAKARAIEREFAQLRVNRADKVDSSDIPSASDKEKRAGVRLTEDGELTESMAESLQDPWVNPSETGSRR